MSLYLIAFLFIVLVALLEIFGLNREFCFASAFLVLAAMLLFRYGQGVDWAAYNFYYCLSPTSFDFSSVFYTEEVHSEIGWKLYTNLIKAIGLPFSFIPISCSIIQLYGTWAFLKKYNAQSSLAMVVVYPVVYLTYFYSAIREGVVLAIFLGYILPKYQEGSSAKAFLAALALSSIHLCALIILLLPIAKLLRPSHMPTAVIICFALGCVGQLVLPVVFASINGFAYSASTASPLAIVYRICMGLAVYFLLQQRKRLANIECSTLFLLKVYIVGLCLYFLLMANDIVASRLSIVLTCVDVGLIPLLVLPSVRKTSFSAEVWLITILLVTSGAVMTVKNLGYYAVEGNYKGHITAFNYPYISYFNADDYFNEVEDSTLKRYMLEE